MRASRKRPRNSSRRKLGVSHSAWREASAAFRASRSVTSGARVVDMQNPSCLIVRRPVGLSLDQTEHSGGSKGDAMTASRVERVVAGRQTTGGAGVRRRRSRGGAELDQFAPFLLLDEFKSEDRNDYIAGFPDHPHRGFETVTYMLAGAMRHEDSRGNRGELGPGSVQWMTAGRGIIHSEMPLQSDGLMWGFQLWVNLPARSKMIEPRYQDIPASAIPEARAEGGAAIRVIAGEALSAQGPVEGIATSP